MALSGTAYDPKLFSFLIAEQDDWGTHAVDETSPNNSLIALDVDSIGSPNLGINQTFDVRSGGRTANELNFVQDTLQSVKEFTISGTATTEGMDLLLSNITGDASSPYAIASNVGGASYSSGTTGQTAQQLLSVVYKSAYGTNSDLAFKDCFCTSLTLSGDTGTAGGQIKFSATLQSGTTATDLTDATTTIDTVITANDYFMSAWNDVAYRKIVGVDDAVLSSFSLTIDNPMAFSGLCSTGYEVATRAGEVSAVADFSILYDTNFVGAFQTFNNQTSGADTGVTLMNNDASLTDGAFGFSMANSILTNVSFNEGSVMMLDLSVKALGAGSDELVSVAV